MSVLPDLRRAAIVDVGSNSVRLVIYEIYGASALPSFNEKVMAGLGRDLLQTGRLSKDGIAAALLQLRRFRAILAALGVDDVVAVATAAVREAKDGAAFAKQAENVLGQKLRILSGEDEARLSAIGVMSGLHAPKGLMGDLGGSSLELKRIGKRSESVGESHLLGPLALEEGEFDAARIRKRVRKTLKMSDILPKGAEQFYAVGGAWRTFAQVHMESAGYALQVQQGYRMTEMQVAATARLCIESVTNPSAMNQLRAVSRRRAPALPYAAIVLEELMDIGGFGSIVISSYGLREGVLREHIGPQESDPLRDGAISFNRYDENQIDFGDTLYDFVAPILEGDQTLFGSPIADERVIRAACMMADSAGRFHPDHRAQMAYNRALRAPYAAVTHPERAMIAHAVGMRYSNKFRRPNAYVSLNTNQEVDRARQLGTAMRLGAVFSGRSGPILRRAKLKRTKDELILKVKADSQEMISDTVIRRLGQTASLLSLEPDVRVR